MANLHDISTNYLEVLSSDFDNDTMKDTLESIEGEFNDKGVNIVKYSKNIDSEVSEIDAEIKRLQERKKVLKNKSESMRDWLRSNMEQSGITKINCSLFSITLGKGVETVVIDDADLLPDDLVDIVSEVKPNKAAIKKALKDGSLEVGARLERGKSRLLIK